MERWGIIDPQHAAPFKDQVLEMSSQTETYRSQCKYLPRALAANIFRDAIKVENKLRKRLAVMPLPLPDGIEGLRRRPLVPRAFHLCLSFFISHSDQFPFECTRLSIIRAP